jgi:hypothetical protein
MTCHPSIWRRPLTWSGVWRWLRERPVVPAGLALLLVLAWWRQSLLAAVDDKAQWWFGRPSNLDRLQPFIRPAWYRMGHRYRNAGVELPPQRVRLIVLKDEQLIELWAASWTNELSFVGYYSFRYTGFLGPKLHDADTQLPEGLYHLTSLEADGPLYLAAHFSYPNKFDRRQAAQDGRLLASGQLFLHAGTPRPGGIAVTERAMEELYTVFSGVHCLQVQMLVVPVDFRHRVAPRDRAIPTPPWVAELYGDLAQQLREYRPPAKPDAEPPVAAPPEDADRLRP